MAMTPMSPHDQGEVRPRARKAVTVATIMWRTGKKADTWAKPEPDLIGYHSPERNSRTKR